MDMIADKLSNHVGRRMCITASVYASAEGVKFLNTVCTNCIMKDEMQCEQCESTCDFATHFFCHYCASCQEVREMQRRSPHPRLMLGPVFVIYDAPIRADIMPQL
ncbi:hypothetical protein C5167_014325 [Papaver somniferum]|uniref:Uncharacterized protein n=1 Tax=Papaver somniferum TaxID=3469 RepID=A0A4Y7J4U7_PAPSO|nr:hypothetical protein C5167_014325 [Papaver somniferum]